MWKKLNSILHDKNDYHLDPSLKQDVEIADELIQSAIKYQKYLIPKKIKYFFTYDKLFFVRLFAKYFLKFLAIVAVVGLFAVIALKIIGIDINLNVKKVPKQDYSQYPVYIPSSGDAKTDSITVLNYRKILNDDIKYVFFYLKDPSKNYEKWKDNLHQLESGSWNNPYEARRENSQYWGKYQMGESARKSVNLDNITWEQWKSNPEIQEAALKMWIDILYKQLKNDIKRYDGTILNGWSITESGIIAMAHNVGSEPVKNFLYSNGKNVPKDGSGREATRFLILGNYDLEINK